MFNPSQYYGDSSNQYSCPQQFWSYGQAVPPAVPVPYYQNPTPPMYTTTQGYMASATGSEAVKMPEYSQYGGNERNMYSSNNDYYMYSHQYSDSNNAVNYPNSHAYPSREYDSSRFPVPKMESHYEKEVSHSKLPSVESFIKECQSGKKSNERLNKEEIIKNSLVKSSKPGPSRNISHSNKKDRDSSFNFVSVKKGSFKKSTPRAMNFCKEPKSKHETNEEFLKRWR